jgi:hypothetical protein|tara:strand:- start:38 stop:628 length:591 start_codon:yes stop_codon:yes gene_type:complete
MALWGSGDGGVAAEKKPTWLTTEDARDVYATTGGWTAAAGGTDNAAAQREVLVAIGNLSEAAVVSTGLAAATISSVNWNISTFDKSAGGTLSVTVNYNEAIDVATGGGTPTIVVTNDQRANHTLSYASGTGTNRLTFTLVIAAANAATNAGDILSVAAQNVAKNGGTIKDAGASTNAQIAISAGHGTATGTVTVVA